MPRVPPRCVVCAVPALGRVAVETYALDAPEALKRGFERFVTRALTATASRAGAGGKK